VIIAFNVVPDERARSAAEERGVQVRRYDIIYQVTDDLRKALEGMLAPEKRETELGRALVQRTFSISRLGVIAGCRVIAGVFARNARLRVIRDSQILDPAVAGPLRPRDYAYFLAPTARLGRLDRFFAVDGQQPSADRSLVEEAVDGGPDGS
jgi:translation initiation factor IF-2